MNVRDDLRHGLRALARQAPAAAVPDDFFDRARARARQRRAVRASAGFVLVLTLALGLGLSRPGHVDSAGQPEAPAAGLPSELHLPPLWAASAESSPPGRTAMIFGGDATADAWNEGRFAAVAADGDRYRVFRDFVFTAPGSEALLSPDGESIARHRAVRSLTRPGSAVELPGDVRAFSPDGSLVVYETGEGTTTLNGRDHYGSRVEVYDLARRSVIAAVDNSDLPLFAGLAVSVSADNTRLALHLGDELRLYRLDAATPAAYATVPLNRELLAGSGSWLPDGSSLVTARRDSDGGPWRLIRRDALTGRETSVWAELEATEARHLRVLGWRADGAAVATAKLAAPDAAPEFKAGAEAGMFQEDGTGRVRLLAIPAGAGTPEVLLETPLGVSDLDVAAQIAAAGVTRASARPDYGPLPPALLLVAAVLVAIGGGVLTWIVRRRIVRRARENPGSR
ncbi:hypothetical protein QLQ12_17315 [Actinoplanes sp. NEAU-A12]|uniref:WD40 repeat domain-containing protein n=1 Tax=Actinoplanes sandaracinus TaxID=3045177 RepID=A0ABT6WKW6_9ACTN|nr:hypothetical protein [Actinoplanes sandaracinus]MDI6100369.1 hypothetical protein [Actinoplanes sandaracinus]